MAEKTLKNKIFGTSYDDNMILEHIIKALDWKHLQPLLATNPMVRAKCKCFDMSKVKADNIAEIKEGLLNCYEKDQKLKIGLHLCWITQTEEEAEIVRKYPETEELRKHIDYNRPPLGVITYLWKTNKEETKALGDELFERFLEKDEIKGDKKMTTKKLKNEETQVMTGELLNKSLLEVIEEVTMAKEKMSALEKSLAEKDAQINELKKQTEYLAYNKELKRQVTKMSEAMEALTQKVTRQETEQTAKLTQMEAQIAGLEKTLLRETRGSSKGQQEIFKNAIDQMNNQVAKQVAKGISSELKNILSEIQMLKSEKAVKAQTVESVERAPKSFKVENKMSELQPVMERDLLSELEQMIGV